LAVLAACRAPSLLIRDDSDVQLAHTTIAGPSTGDRGPYGTKFLYYGSGTDKNRAVYRDSVSLKTRPVNATPFLRGGDKKALAERWNPGGHPKLPHSWPGQTPPPSGGGTDRS
jgi:hypothetical protein